MMLEKAQQYKDTLSLVAYLFGYPDVEWWSALEDCRGEAKKIESRQNAQVILDFLDYVQELGQKEYEEIYVRVFEFSSNTNLYLTMHDRTDFGKQAREMQSFKTLFLDNGYDLDKELPDYLPAVLELTASISATQARKVLKAAQPKIELLRDRFVEAKLVHTLLLDIILTETDELKEESA